ncbi:hypothetical protein CDAR_76801 [Caerostris darwini]|uniref:Uncharacterized protein n=1 Tax=Caerostris darwini TaxID=1538125 RepID=A0AAV4QAY3_9ARAC|nr:hypothetical protein CDAR_76801 [Caerostris darwini]
MSYMTGDDRSDTIPTKSKQSEGLSKRRFPVGLPAPNEVSGNADRTESPTPAHSTAIAFSLTSRPLKTAHTHRSPLRDSASDKEGVAGGGGEEKRKTGILVGVIASLAVLTP